ncbi:hypothetical protein Trydic_g20338 [Trypoxylus dichotomus]
MFGPLSYGEFVQGSALRTWNCVAHFAGLLWYKFAHLRDPIMPRSRRRHHSRSRSRSRSHSHDRDREPKRRKIESYDSPHHRRSVSSEPEAIEIDENEVKKEEIHQEKEVITEIDKDDEKSIQANATKSEHITDLDSEDPEPEEDSKTQLHKHGSISSNDESESAANQSTTRDESQLLEDIEDINDSSEDEEESSSRDGGKSDSIIIEDNLEDSIKNNTPNRIKGKAGDLKITPQKVLSPKQLQRKLEFEKKRQEKEKAKEESKRKRLEMKEEKERQKMEEKKRIDEEKKKVNEERIRLKQEKEEQKIKEKLAKQEEKDKKRREKEEKEELKKKEREQEKLKKQQELEEKNKEKQKLEEQKQKTSAAFVNFFVTKKSDSTEEKKSEEPSKFMPFEVKSDMRLAPLSRRSWKEEDDKVKLDEQFEKQDDKAKLYLEELKEGKEIGVTSKTWPFEEADPEDDVVIVEENVGETIVEQKSKLEKMRVKFLKFHENQRPPYFGTWKKKSAKILARKPFGKDEIFNYEVDSDEEWEEEGEGESLKGTDDEDEKENESDHEYEEDNEVFVPHGYLSDDETNDEEKAKLSPSAHKAKLKLLKNEFDEEMKSKMQKIKPRVIGCIWYNKDKSNVEDAIDRYLQPFSIICNGRIHIKKRSDLILQSSKKAPKQLGKEHVPIFLKLIHGSVDKRKNIVKDFIEYMSNNGIQIEVSQLSLGRQLKTFAKWQKCPEEGPMHNKLCWYVGEDVRKEYSANLTLPNQVKTRQKKVK